MTVRQQDRPLLHPALLQAFFLQWHHPVFRQWCTSVLAERIPPESGMLSSSEQNWVWCKACKWHHLEYDQLVSIEADFAASENALARVTGVTGNQWKGYKTREEAENAYQHACELNQVRRMIRT